MFLTDPLFHVVAIPDTQVNLAGVVASVPYTARTPSLRRNDRFRPTMLDGRSC